MTEFAIVLGAQKAGTTAMFENLRRHPNLTPSRKKETGFFSNDERYSGGLSAYLNEFEGPDHTLRLEVDPQNLCNPMAPGRIRETLGPDVHFVAILRDPACRAFSQHTMETAYGYENLAFADALEQEAERTSRPGRHTHVNYLARGRYFEQLSRYLEHFPSDQFRLFVYEHDYLPDPASVLSEVCSFLDIPKLLGPVDARPHNVGYRPRSLATAKILRHALLDQGRFSKAGRAMVPRRFRLGIRNRLVDANRSRRPKPSLSTDEHDATIDRYFLDDIAKTEDLIGRSLEHWRPKCSD